MVKVASCPFSSIKRALRFFICRLVAGLVPHRPVGKQPLGDDLVQHPGDVPVSGIRLDSLEELLHGGAFAFQHLYDTPPHVKKLARDVGFRVILFALLNYSGEVNLAKRVSRFAEIYRAMFFHN